VTFTLQLTVRIDMGFEPQVNRVLDSLVVLPENRRTIMFSATMSPVVENLAQRFMKPNPLIINVGDAESSSGHNPNIEQNVLVISTELAREREMLRALQTASAPIIIFCNEKSTCDLVVRALRGQSAHKAVVLHSGRSQEERESNLRGFKEGTYGILVATDVAGGFFMWLVIFSSLTVVEQAAGSMWTTCSSS